MRFREANEVLGRVSTPADGYKALAASVIVTACDDYLRAVSLKDPLRIQSIERFLLSERFLVFSDGADGAYILRRLKEIAKRNGGAIEARPVCSLDRDGNVQNTYASAAQAATDFHGDRRSITRACNTGRMCYGFYWGYADERD